MGEIKLSAVRAILPVALVFGTALPQASATTVDAATFDGWKIYKRERCETCHGANAEGAAVFPSLLISLQSMTKTQFSEVVLNGRKNMPMFKNNKKVADGLDNLYTFLRGRAEGRIPPGELEQVK